MKDKKIITSIDVGTTKIAVIIASTIVEARTLFVIFLFALLFDTNSLSASASVSATLSKSLITVSKAAPVCACTQLVPSAQVPSGHNAREREKNGPPAKS